MFRSLMPGWSKTQEAGNISDFSFNLRNRLALKKKEPCPKYLNNPGIYNMKDC